MQDKDFDSLLKRKFEHQDLQEHQDGKWATLTERLDAFDHKRNSRYRLAYAMALAALLLGNLAGLFYWLGSSSSHTSSPHEPFVKRDTLFQTIHIVRYDTIYRTLILENTSINPIKSENFGNTLPSDLSSSTNPKVLPDTTSQSLKVSERSTGGEVASYNEITNAGSNPSMPPSNNDMPIAPVQIPDFKHKANVILPLKPLKPSLLLLDQGIITPPIPVTKVIPNTILQEQNQPRPEEPIQKKPSFQWQPMWINGGQVLFFPDKLEGYVVSSGLQMEKNISSRIALGGSLRFGLASAESSDMTRLPSLDNTPPTQPGPAYIFDHWDVDFMPLLQYQLYGHLKIASLGKVRLMAGAGTQWISTLPYQIDYQYIHRDRFDEKDLESEKNAETRWQGLNLLLQAEKPIGSKVVLGTRLHTVIPRRPLQTVLDQSLGLDFWLKFRL